MKPQLLGLLIASAATTQKALSSHAGIRRSARLKPDAVWTRAATTRSDSVGIGGKTLAGPPENIMAQRRMSLAISAASMRPTVIGRSQAIACGHYLAALASMRVLDRGGNAVDAGVTAAMALAVLQPDIVSFAGVAPTLIYLAKEDRVISLAGLGYWPAATDINRLLAAGDGKTVPEGLLRTVMPAAPATHIEALRRYGTISFEEAATPAMELARDGYAVYPFLANNLNGAQDQYRRWPSSARIFLPGGQPPRYGELFRQEDLEPQHRRHDRSGTRRARRPRQETARRARLLLSRPDRRGRRRLSRAERRLSHRRGPRLLRSSRRRQHQRQLSRL